MKNGCLVVQKKLNYFLKHTKNECRIDVVWKFVDYALFGPKGTKRGN
jgi:hypothetical protein